MKKILNPTYSLNLKNIILLLNRALLLIWFFLKWSYSQRCFDVENDNVVSTLSNIVQFNVEIQNVVSTLLNVVDFNVEVRNVVSTLIWCCATSRRHNNLKATLNRRWNVCWVKSPFYSWTRLAENPYLWWLY